MAINLQGRKMVYYGGILAMIGLILGGVTVWRLTQYKKTPQASLVATFALQKAMKALPQWGRYEQINQQIDEVQGKLIALGLMNPNVKSEGVGLLGSQPPLDDPNSLFELAVQERRETLMNASQGWQKTLVNELNTKANEKAKQLEKEMDETISQQQAIYEKKLKQYQEEVQFDYSAKLSDIDFKLMAPGLSDGEKALLIKEKQSVKDEMDNLIATKKAEYTKALESFSKEQQKTISDAMKDFQVQLRSQFEQQMKDKKLLLDKEFRNWVTQEKKSHQQKMSNLRNQHLPDFLELKSLNAEQESLRLEMVETIRRKLKVLMEEEKQTVVLVNPSNGLKDSHAILSFTRGKDITDELVSALR